MLCGREGNCRSGVALAMRHGLNGRYTNLWAHWPQKREEPVLQLYMCMCVLLCQFVCV